MAPRTRYATCGDFDIAYQVTGEGPLDIVLVPSFVSNIEFWWTSPVVKSWFDRIASFARLILFDRAGTGLSDPILGPRTLEQRAEEIEAVMDTVGSQRAVLFGLSEGGPMGLRVAGDELSGARFHQAGFRLVGGRDAEHRWHRWRPSRQVTHPNGHSATSD